MQARLLIAAGWLLGAGTATSISLLAVSLLGQGIISSPGQQLTVAAVNQALASETSKPPDTHPAPSPRDKAPAVPDPSPSRMPSPSAHAPASHYAGHRPAAQGKVLTSEGGTVVAGCVPDGAYLSWWSPQPGFEVGFVRRGPAPAVKAVFRSDWGSVTMVISCHDGVPVAASGSDGGRHSGGWG